MNDSDKTKAQLIQELNDLRAGADDRNASELQRISNLIDYSRDAIYVIDLATGRFVDVNSKAVSSLGYSREELLTMGVSDIEKTLPDDFSWKEHVSQLTPMPTRIRDGEHKRKDGTVFPVEVSIRITDEKEGFMVSVARDITERKKIEHQQAEREYFLKESQKAASIGSYRADFLAGTWESSEVLDQIFGIDENYNRTIAGWLDIIHPDDRESMERYLAEEVIARPHAFDREYRIIRQSDNQTRWVYGLGRVSFDTNGKALSLIGTLQDITERKLAEEALRDSKVFSDSLLELSPDIIYIYDIVERKNVYASASTAQVLGYTEEETQAMGDTLIADLMHPDDFKVYLNETVPRYKTAKDGEIIEHEYRMKHKDGTWFWLHSKELIYARMADGTPWQIFGLIGNITDRRNAEEALRAYVEFMDSVPGFGFAKDANLKYVSANRAFCDLLNIPYDQIKGKTDYDIFPADLAKKYIADDKRVIETGKPILVEETTINSKTKQRFTVATRKHPWLDKNGNTIGLYGMGFDISEIKEAEKREKELLDKLTRAERMESLGVLAGGVAHDLNNVLGPMVALPDIILEDLSELETLNIEETKESLDVIRTSAKRAGAIVKDLVSLGRRGHYNLVHMDISQIQCLSPDCNTKVIDHLRTDHPDATFVNEPHDGPLLISGDESHLSRAISNLVQNAAEAIEKKGTVTIKTFKKSLDTPLEGYETILKGDYAVIEISDDGDGIGKDKLARIFEPFYTRKKKTDRSGSGLGLSVVNGIIKDHAGFIDVKSDVGKGSVFTVYLPLIAQTKEEGQESEVAPVVGGTERILIVDDEPGQVLIGRKSLQRQGYDVAEATDGHHALAHFQKAKESGAESPYDLIVLDMIMEEGFDGLDTYQAILKLYPNQKALVASGHAEDGRARATAALGAGWLAKPYEVDDLVRAVRNILDRDE